MRVAEFDYELPPDRIAQRPAEVRDRARLLVLDRESGATEDAVFTDLVGWLRAGDLLVLNDTRVVPARLVGRKASGGRVELLLVERQAVRGCVWSCLLRASRPPAPDARLDFGPALAARVEARSGELWTLAFESPTGTVAEALEQAGLPPLPPYLERPDPGAAGARELAQLDRERYQTVFARCPGAVAAPTAGLHFTPELLGRIEAAGVEIRHLTLHVGPGTFRPVRCARVEDHRLHAEPFELPEDTAAAVRRTRLRGGQVVAVGTTVVRTLEHRAADGGTVAAGAGWCDLFIRPGHRFRVVDALVTNFHLPRSTLLMLVAAFAGRERLLAAYAGAIARGYRFYSYGDAMLVRSAR